MGNPNYDNAVLGAGITGLITFYYLAETTNTRNILITKSLESQTNTRFQLGPRFLRYNRDTEALLKRLGLPTTTKEIFIGWETEAGEVRNYPEFDDIREKTEDINTFTVFTISQTTLSKALLEKCLKISKESQKNHVIIDEIKNINYKKITTKKNVYYANHIISTIPLGSLTGLLSTSSMTIKISSSQKDTYFFLVDEKEKGYFDYVYGSEKNPWFRKTFIPEEKKWVYETDKAETFCSIFSEWIVGKGIKISQDLNNHSKIKELGNNINLVGRYGQMNHNIRTEDIIHWAYNYTRKFKKRD